MSEEIEQLFDRDQLAAIVWFYIEDPKHADVRSRSVDEIGTILARNASDPGSADEPDPKLKANIIGHIEERLQAAKSTPEERVSVAAAVNSLSNMFEAYSLETAFDIAMRVTELAVLHKRV